MPQFADVRASTFSCDICYNYFSLLLIIITTIYPFPSSTKGTGFVVVVALLFYVHGKHLRSCRDGQLT